eukprot:TRINITY_DN34297_c0_g1_i1.p1 TRINITY_DN34297_c0_g1~~TRINITY_DN34297_c0_g1_i1.p1  ORF type:complete len:210 (+),score=52.37 TRINITY_DN34297_c0_g1_i1:85-714(+)
MKSALALGMALVGCTMAQGPSIAVYKELADDNCVVGTNISVTLTVYNYGSTAAFNIEMDDSNWGGTDTIIKESWESIAPGANVSTSYTVMPSEAGIMAVEPAKVTYKTETGSDSVKVAFSNNVYDVSVDQAPGLPVLTEAEYEKKTSRRTKEWITFLLLLVIPIGMPFFFYKQSSNTLSAKKATAKAEEKAKVTKRGSPTKKSSGKKKN